jgi:predicted flap endonuclease-1-like 5' DNA nuclease
MRLDYTLYVLAAVFFLIAAVSFAMVMEQPERNLWVVVTVVLALFSLGLGYYERPKAKTAAVPQPAVSAVIEDAHAKEAYRAENVEEAGETPLIPETTTPVPMQVLAPIPVPTPASVETPATPTINLTDVRGIGEKRATQLRAIGVNSVEELAKASAEELATKLKISSKITEKWISIAKELVK